MGNQARPSRLLAASSIVLNASSLRFPSVKGIKVLLNSLMFHIRAPEFKSNALIITDSGYLNR
jgi:hypothetical protein